MNKLIINISGMHCRSCEILIEEELGLVPGIKKSKVNWKKGIAEIFYSESKPDSQKIEEAVRSAGYAIGTDGKKSLFSRNASDYEDLGIASVIIIGLYFVLKSLGFTNLNFGAGTQDPQSLGVVLAIGLTAGFSTCMALVGGLVLGASTRHAEAHPEATVTQKFRPHLYFNLGRVLGFAFLGAILGTIGSFFQISTLALGIMTIAVGLVMFFMGLQLIEIFPWANGIKITLPKFLSRRLGIKNNKKEYSHKSSMLLGALTFFLPCGFTQAMQLYAVSTGSPVMGALVMGTFALGTVPGLLSIGGLTSVVKGIFAKRFFKFAGLLVIFFALFNISNGYNLTGWQIGSASSGGSSINDPNVTLENGTQVVKMTQAASGYSPNKFTVKKGIPVKWVIDGQEPFSCSSSIVIPSLNISKKLVRGENTIEFTPTETGPLKFSCSMGMYMGVFNVVDSQSSTVSSVADSNSSIKSSGGSCSASGGGCGCGGGTQKPVQPSEGTVEQNGNTPTAGDNNSGLSGSASPQQIIRTSYTLSSDIQPNTFTVKAGVPVKFIIDVKEDGQGCMSTVMILGLYNNAQSLQKGTVEMDFTPMKPGDYKITCAMGVPRGTLKVQ